MKTKSKYLNKQGSLKNEEVAIFFKSLLSKIKGFIESSKSSPLNTPNTLDEEDFKRSKYKTHFLNIEDLISIPLNLALNDECLIEIGKISESFIKSRKVDGQLSFTSLNERLLSFLGSCNFYSLDDFTTEDSINFFRNLTEEVDKDLQLEKVILYPCSGAFLNLGEECWLGPVQFLDKKYFIDSMNEISCNFRDDDEQKRYFLEFTEDFCRSSDLVAYVHLVKRDELLAQEGAREIMKRVFTLFQMMLPRVGYQHRFFGKASDAFSSNSNSLALKVLDGGDIHSFTINRSNTRLSDSDINLLSLISQYKTDENKSKKWLFACEMIIEKLSNNENLSAFEKRIWNALYWLGEAFSESEVNSLIVKIATCLEALFNAREGGISEQISEFTAFVIGHDKIQRMKIYEDVKLIYKLRSDVVHGRVIDHSIDQAFMYNALEICKLSIVNMAFFSLHEEWQGSRGFNQFVKYIFQEHRFS